MNRFSEMKSMGKCAAASALIIVVAQAAGAGLLGSAFSFQGQLKAAGMPLNGDVDLRFTLFSAQVGGQALAPTFDAQGVQVVDGVFSVELDFAASVFDGAERWLEIEVSSPSGSGVFESLSPRQHITATPYALQTRGLFVDNAGRIGIGVTAPQTPFSLMGNGGTSPVGITQNAVGGNHTMELTTTDSSGNQASRIVLRGGSTGDTADIEFYTGAQGAESRTMIIDGATGNVGIGALSSAKLNVSGDIRASSVVLDAGADIAEPFDVNEASNVLPGTVVGIDPNDTGKLRITDQPYDSRIAGVISGAGGVNAALMLSQKGSVADGEHPVALTGRVWCLCDADANGAIAPGDLLTSAATPGHAMKATDRSRAFGATLGKAMSSLHEGKGLVLILVRPN